MPVGEQLAEQPEICIASLDAARQIVSPLLAELATPQSVLYQVASERMAGLPVGERFNIAPLLLADPSRSGVIVERWRMQAGEMPADAADDASPEKMVALWAANTSNIKRLTVPEGAEPAVMNLADRLQMRGGGPIVFAREEVSRMEHLPNTVLQVTGAANRANLQRVESALAYYEAHGDPELPIIATVDPTRILRGKEPETVAEFAPEATNELELFVDSAIAKGFVASTDNRYGVRFLEDGSCYLRMSHPSGAQLLVLAPRLEMRADGSKQTGVFNAYKSQLANEKLVSDSFSFAGSHVIHVTSSHYGSMAIMNNLRAVHELRTHVGSFRVIGDNQPARTAQAHLIEVGLTTNAALEATQDPAIAAELLPTE